MSRAFVLGNGVSRQGIDLDLLLSLGPVYGCNAIYREFTPTVLISTDVPISEAIQRTGYAQKNRMYTRRPLPDSGAVRIDQEYFGYSSGPVAVSIAAADANKCDSELNILVGITLNAIEHNPVIRYFNNFISCQIIFDICGYIGV